ncbi:hypothetical protein OF83DRAFT_1179629 [Amylostereum chailletii]|nr:hypothetical protein OF83DRAFT_1179629 [Amylostereum chailletii]
MPTSLLEELRTLLDNLPSQLPLQDGIQSKYGRFLNFDLDPDLMEKIEDEVGVVSEQFKAVFGWQTRTAGDGVIKLVERGRALSTVVDVLSLYLDRNPGNAVLTKWAEDIAEGARKAYQDHAVPIPTIRTTNQSRNRKRAATSSSIDSVNTEKVGVVVEGSDVEDNLMIGDKKLGRRRITLMDSIVVRIPKKGSQKTVSWRAIQKLYRDPSAL